MTTKCQKCKSKINSIHIFDNTGSPFECPECAIPLGRKQKDRISFGQLKDDDNYHYFSNFPPLEEDVIQQMTKFQEKQCEIEQIEKKLGWSKSMILVCIDQVVYEAKQYIKNLNALNENVWNKYHELSQRKKLRQILKDKPKDMENQVAQILEKINKKILINNNSQAMSKCLEQNKFDLKQLNFDIKKTIQEGILSSINKIDFFFGSDLQQQNLDRFKDEEEEEKENLINNERVIEEYHNHQANEISDKEILKKSQDYENSSNQRNEYREILQLLDYILPNSILVSEILDQEILKKSQYKQSHELDIKMENGHLVVENQSPNSFKTVYCNFNLDKNIQYTFKIRIQQTTENDNNWLMFGLLQDNDKDYQDLDDDKLYYDESDGGCFSKKIDHRCLFRGNGEIVNREFEVVIKLNQKIFKIRDPQISSNFFHIDNKDHIKNDVDYVFGMGCFYQSKMIITEISEK